MRTLIRFSQFITRLFSNQPALKACYPRGLDDPARSENIARFIKVLGWKETDIAAAKMVDNETGEICAFATMRLYNENPFSTSRGTNKISSGVDCQYKE